MTSEDRRLAAFPTHFDIERLPNAANETQITNVVCKSFALPRFDHREFLKRKKNKNEFSSERRDLTLNVFSTMAKFGKMVKMMVSESKYHPRPSLKIKYNYNYQLILDDINKNLRKLSCKGIFYEGIRAEYTREKIISVAKIAQRYNKTMSDEIVAAFTAHRLIDIKTFEMCHKLENGVVFKDNYDYIWSNFSQISKFIAKLEENRTYLDGLLFKTYKMRYNIVTNLSF